MRNIDLTAYHQVRNYRYLLRNNSVECSCHSIRLEGNKAIWRFKWNGVSKFKGY